MVRGKAIIITKPLQQDKAPEVAVTLFDPKPPKCSGLTWFQLAEPNGTARQRPLSFSSEDLCRGAIR